MSAGRCRALVLALGALLAIAPSVRAQEKAPAPSEHRAIPDLRRMLMGEFDAMNAASQGIFHEDVTASLAPYFPVGQPLAETRKIIAEQHLGALHNYMGVNDSGMGTMFVTRFDLVSGMSAHISVVVDFDYDQAGGEQARLTHMKAFLRAANM